MSPPRSLPSPQPQSHSCHHLTGCSSSGNGNSSRDGGRLGGGKPRGIGGGGREKEDDLAKSMAGRCGASAANDVEGVGSSNEGGRSLGSITAAWESANGEVGLENGSSVGGMGLIAMVSRDSRDSSAAWSLYGLDVEGLPFHNKDARRPTSDTIDEVWGSVVDSRAAFRR